VICQPSVSALTAIALGRHACYSTFVPLDVADDTIVAGAFDINDPDHWTSAFYLGRPPGSQTAEEEFAAVFNTLQGLETVAATVLQNGSPVPWQYYHGDNISAGALLELHTTGLADLSGLRNDILVALSGLPASAFDALPPDMGVSARSFIMILTTATHHATNCGPATTSVLAAIVREEDYLSGRPARIHLENVGDPMAIGVLEGLQREAECDAFQAETDGQQVFVEPPYPLLAASLAVAASTSGGGEPAEFLPPSMDSGFYYDQANGRVVLTGRAPDELPLEVVVAYERWVAHALPQECWPVD
jgi:hypothetical protein